MVSEAKLQNIIDAGEQLGYIPLSKLDDPKAKAQFYAEHPVYIDDTEIDNGEVTIECSCHIVKGNMGYKFPVGFWGSDAYLPPTNWQNLYHLVENDVWGGDSYLDHDWVEPFYHVYSTSSGVKSFTGDYLIPDENYDDTEDSGDQFLIAYIAHREDFEKHNNFVPEDTTMTGSIKW